MTIGCWWIFWLKDLLNLFINMCMRIRWDSLQAGRAQARLDAFLILSRYCSPGGTKAHLKRECCFPLTSKNNFRGCTCLSCWEPGVSDLTPLPPSLQMLCANPTAKVCFHGFHSNPIPILQGTKQGVPFDFRHSYWDSCACNTAWPEFTQVNLWKPDP